MAYKNYEIHINVLNEKPPEELTNNFNYTIDKIINRIIGGGELIENQKK